MKLTPQVIIDKEFRVKFRGFDMAEVDTFLEEVAESFFKLIEENTRLNEQVDALQEKITSGGVPSVPGQVELSPELENFLEELKQDTSSINAELVSLKQDRTPFTSLEKNLQDAVAAIKDAKTSSAGQVPADLTAELKTALQAFTEGTKAINAELAAIKEERQSFSLLKNTIGETLALIKEAGPSATPQDQTDKIPLAETLDDFRQTTKSMGDELGAIKKEVSAIQKLQAENKKDLLDILKSQFADLAAKLAQPSAGPVMPQAKGPVKEEPLKAAIIEEEPEDSRLPDYEDEDDSVAEDELEFLSEDDILDVEKLRGIFQSVLDDSVSDAPSSRGDDETTADLLFFDDDLLEIEHEPAVTFSIEGKSPAGKKPEKMKKN